MRVAVVVVLMICLISSFALSEAMWGDLPLGMADTTTRIQKERTIEQVRLLRTPEELEVGDIRHVSLYEEKVLVFVDTLDSNVHIWLFDVNGYFYYAYDVIHVEPVGGDSVYGCLSADGSILLRWSKGRTILGLKNDGHTVDLKVYNTPREVLQYEYDFPSRSNNRVVSVNQCKLVVRTPGGIRTVFDYSAEYDAYKEIKDKENVKGWLMWGVFYLPIALCVIWIARNEMKNKSEEKGPPDLRNSTF